MLYLYQTKLSEHAMRREFRKAEKVGLVPHPIELLRQRCNKLNHSNFPSERWFMTAAEKHFATFPVRVRCSRNHPALGVFFIDFFFRRGRLAIEIDGRSHDGKKEHDEWRDGLLTRAGNRVIRIKHGDENALHAALLEIENLYPKMKRVEPARELEGLAKSVASTLRKEKRSLRGTAYGRKAREKAAVDSWPSHIDKAKVLSWFKS
ncbi:MAG: DUF559 domain-containing protein [Bdellovibrionaceae bacterium]|nr:DUF559 domain-containing protein [Pseudobdellovibrionaceae bacterium]